MTPNLELGLGLVIGLATATFVFWSVNWIRSQRVFTDKESSKRLQLTQDILREIDAPCLIVDGNAKVVFANQSASEIDGSTGLYSQLKRHEVQTSLAKSLTTATALTVEPDTSDAAHNLKLRIFALDKQYAVILVADLSSEMKIIAMRRDFITNLSHEIKTPIAAISLLSEALTKASSSPEIVQRFATKLQGEATRLNELSKDVIRLSEAQAPLTEAETEIFDIARTAQKESLVHQEIASQNNVELIFVNNLKGNQQAFVKGRPSAISAAIANLISNAVAHSPQGGIVEVSITKNKKSCLITVTDQGPGIAPEHHERVFERFFRLDESRSRSLGGTGLGLSIVRNAARAHGGDVSINSAVGQGAVFKISVPLTRSKGS